MPYKFSPEKNQYVLISEVQTYQSSYTETHEECITTTVRAIEQWTVSTEHGYAKAQASDVLFQNDPKVLHTPEVVEDDADTECITWYQPKQPMQKPSNSTEYSAPHHRYVGYDQTNARYRTSNIRRNTISSSGDSSHYSANSRSNSRQPPFQAVPQQTRSVSRATYPTRAPAVNRERAQRKPQLMPVYNLVNSKRKTKRSATNQTQRVYQQPEEAQSVRKVGRRWVKGYVAPKPKSTHKAVCYQFRDCGFCDWGNKCKFSHDVCKKTTKNTTAYPKTLRPSTITTASFTPVLRNRFDAFNAPDEQTF